VIPADYIAEWRQHVSWVPSSQVEQDLVLSRVLVEIFGDADLAESLAFRRRKTISYSTTYFTCEDG